MIYKYPLQYPQQLNFIGVFIWIVKVQNTFPLPTPKPSHPRQSGARSPPEGEGNGLDSGRESGCLEVVLMGSDFWFQKRMLCHKERLALWPGL